MYSTKRIASKPEEGIMNFLRRFFGGDENLDNAISKANAQARRDEQERNARIEEHNKEKARIWKRHSRAAEKILLDIGKKVPIQTETYVDDLSARLMAGEVILIEIRMLPYLVSKGYRSDYDVQLIFHRPYDPMDDEPWIMVNNMKTCAEVVAQIYQKNGGKFVVYEQGGRIYINH